MNRKKAITSGMFLLLGIGTLHAQQTIPASGGNAAGSGGSVSYSVGQVVYTAANGSNGTITQGVQQPFEISEVTGVEDIKGVSLSISAYPNPTIDYLLLQIDEADISNLSYQLYDMKGQLVQFAKISENQTSIEMSSLAPATYFIKVIQGNAPVKTFKIIKNH